MVSCSFESCTNRAQYEVCVGNIVRYACRDDLGEVISLFNGSHFDVRYIGDLIAVKDESTRLLEEGMRRVEIRMAAHVDVIAKHSQRLHEVENALENQNEMIHGLGRHVADLEKKSVPGTY